MADNTIGSISEQFTRLGKKSANASDGKDAKNAGVQTSESLNNEKTKPPVTQNIELPNYQWSNSPESEDANISDNPDASGVDSKTTRNLKDKTTRDRVSQSSSTANKQGTNVRVVQYTREVKPERVRKTVYLYPEVVRWIKRRIAETDEEISDVGNYTAHLCMWMEENHPEILAKFNKKNGY